MPATIKAQRNRIDQHVERLDELESQQYALDDMIEALQGLLIGSRAKRGPAKFKSIYRTNIERFIDKLTLESGELDDAIDELDSFIDDLVDELEG